MKNESSIWLELTEVSIDKNDKGVLTCQIAGKGLFLFGEGGINHMVESSHTETNGGTLLAIEPHSKTYTAVKGELDEKYNLTGVKEDFDEIKSKLKKAGFNIG